MRTLATPWPERVLVIRDLESHEEWFTREELALANGFHLEKRRDEWLLSRVAAKQLAMELGLVRDPRTCEVVRPRLVIEGRPTEWFVSLSHSQPYAGAALSREPLGLDVQVIRELPDAAAHLFLSREEEEEMRNCAVAHRMLHFWSAKEAAWKKRGGAVATLKQVPLRLVRSGETFVEFDEVESVQLEDAIVALTVATTRTS